MNHDQETGPALHLDFHQFVHHAHSHFVAEMQLLQLLVPKLKPFRPVNSGVGRRKQQGHKVLEKLIENLLPESVSVFDEGCHTRFLQPLLRPVRQQDTNWRTS